jgi:hypothetical protein
MALALDLVAKPVAHVTHTLKLPKDSSLTALEFEALNTWLRKRLNLKLNNPSIKR